MVFSSFIFLMLFLPIVLAIYYVMPKVARNYVLLAASLVFYAWGEPVYVFLMIVSIILAWILGLKLDKACVEKRTKAAKVYVLISKVAFM